MKKFLLSIMAVMMSAMSSMAADWVAPSSTDYQDYTPVYVRPIVDGIPATSNYAITIAAFVNGECRAVSSEISPLGTGNSNYCMELLVRGDKSEIGQLIEYKAEYEGIEYTFAATSVFNPQVTIKYPFNLELITAGSIVGISLPEQFILDGTVHETVDLMQHLQVTYTQGDNTIETSISKLPSHPNITWQTYSNGEVTVSESGVVTAVSSTDAYGVSVEASIIVSTGTESWPYPTYKWAYTSIIVTPTLKRLIYINIQDRFELPKGETLDLKEYITLTFASLNDEGEQVTEEVKYYDVPESQRPILYYNSWSQQNEDCITLGQNGIVTAISSTTIEGVNVSIDGGQSGAKGVHTLILVTPISYQIVGIELTSPNTIQVDDSYNINSYTFTVITGREWDYESQQDVILTEKKKYNEINMTDVVLFEYDKKYFNVYGTTYGQYILSAKARTTKSGTPVKFYLQNNPSIFCDAIIYITPFVVPLEDIDLTYYWSDEYGYESFNGWIFTVGYSDPHFKIKLTPEDADFDPSLLSFDIYAEDYTDNGWRVAKLDSKNGINWTLFPYTSCNALITMLYDDPDNAIGKEYSLEFSSQIPIEKGWNWSSLFVMGAEIDTPTELATFHGSINEIRSQTEATYKDSQYGFFGSLKQLTNAAYHICSGDTYPIETWVADEGNRSYASQTIDGQWTWMYYPYQCNYTLEELTANGCIRSAMEGDRIIAMDDGFAIYTDGEWVANDGFELKAGISYLYYSATGNMSNINWKTEYLMPQPAHMIFDENPRPAPQREECTWQYDAHQYANNMVIVATVDSQEPVSVGAFVGDECRGKSSVVEHNGHRYYFITVHGIEGEPVSFRASNGSEVVELSTVVDFTDMTGSLSNPLALGHVETNGISIIGTDQPVTETYDLNGRRVSEPTASGIYVVRQNDKTQKVIK